MINKMIENFCLRCGKKLTNEKSIKLGYGKTCYILHQHENNSNSNNEITNTLNFLKCEINMIKNQLSQLKNNGISQNIPIERIKQSTNTIMSKDENKMNDVIKEMKELFVSVSNVRELLIHVEVI